MKHAQALVLHATLAVVCVLAATLVPASAQEAPSLGEGSQGPLVVYYSRQGHARMLATALKNHLHADIEEIRSEKGRGIFTIICEQLFGLGRTGADGGTNGRAGANRAKLSGADLRCDRQRRAGPGP